MFGVKEKNMKAQLPSVEEMLKAGMHFGHRTNRWHPKMKPYIFGVKNGLYVIDLVKSQQMLGQAIDFMSGLVMEGKSVLFVGTKSQAKTAIKKAAEESGQAYVVGKWLGGYITNFPVVKRSIKKYQDLIEKQATGKLEKYTKKEQADFGREIKKLEARVGGLVGLNKLPDALFVWDLKEEKTAVDEARAKHIPIIAVCDTNTNPELASYPIPGNDDSTKTIELVLSAVKNNLIEAKKNQKAAGEAKKEEK